MVEAATQPIIRLEYSQRITLDHNSVGVDSTTCSVLAYTFVWEGMYIVNY